ncbi:hypothetical protein, partial [Salmonella enterica]|uniref:hypothetical protein n=1 Tax=Salmonella enterica TaxID=28901 RepID=UPI00329A3266
AGRIGGTVALVGVPGVTLSGAIGLAVNNTGADVTETFTVNGVSTTLAVAAGTSLQLSGTAVTLAVGGVSLTADVAITKGTTDLTVTIGNGA